MSVELKMEHRGMSVNKLRLELIEKSKLNRLFKGAPADADGLVFNDIPVQNWNVLKGDLPLPVAVLRESAIDTNSAWMRSFLRRTKAEICPHGKTTMAPQIFQRQLDEGAWGITAATVGHVQTYRAFGVRRIIMANQLVDPQGIRFVLDELRRDPEFDFYCLVDSAEGVDSLAAAVSASGLQRPLQVLVEMGVRGGRTGVRDPMAARELCRYVSSQSGTLSLRGVEAFEGIFSLSSSSDPAQEVSALLTELKTLALFCVEEDLFAPGPVILTAGGSAYFDLVASHLGDCLPVPMNLVLRSGCYLTHDIGLYQRSFAAIEKRVECASDLGPSPVPALEVWAYIQSLPETGRAIATFGKRDVSHDIELPLLTSWYRPGLHEVPQPLPGNCKVIGLNDQHATLKVPADHPFAVGDMVSVGISHPCTTFDKWQLLYVVDDRYNIKSGIRTFF